MNAEPGRRTNFNLTSCLGASLLFFLAAPLARGQGDCKTLFDADDKMISTDHHAFSSETSGSPGKASARENESITAGGVSYVKVKGAWRKSPLTLAELHEQK